MSRFCHRNCCPVRSGARVSVRAVLLTVCTGLGIGLAGFGTSASGQHPSAPRLMPDGTVFFLHVHNVPELRERFGQTSLGQILTDPQMQPLVGELRGELRKAFTTAQERLGVTLDELLQIPQGEVAIALIAPDAGPISFAALLDVGERGELVRKLIAQGLEQRNDLGPPITERVGQTELRIHPNSGEPRTAASPEPPIRITQSEQPREAEGENRQRRRQVGVEVRRRRSGEVCYFERDGAFVLSDSRETAKRLLAAWDGEEVSTLASNAQYTAIMNRSFSDKDGAPQVSFFVDPISIASRGV